MTVKSPTPAEIEKLLYEGAKYTGRSIEVYRQAISELAEKHGIRFDQALQIATPANIELVRNAREGLERLDEEAARLGCTTGQLHEAYKRAMPIRTGATEQRIPVRRKLPRH